MSIMKLIPGTLRKRSILILFSMVAFNSYAQNSFEMHIGPTFPTGDFSSALHGAGGASIGFNVGLEYSFPVSDKGFQVFVGTDFFYNELKKETKDLVTGLLTSFGATSVDFDHSKYYNIPISTGVKYWLETTETASFYFDAGLTLNFLKITDATSEVRTDVGNINSTIQYEDATKIGFRLGVGALIKDKILTSADYLLLGDHNVSSRINTDGEIEQLEGIQNVSFFRIRLGLLLW